MRDSGVYNTNIYITIDQVANNQGFVQRRSCLECAGSGPTRLATIIPDENTNNTIGIKDLEGMN